MTQSPTHTPITTVLVDDHHLLRQGIISIISELRDVKVVGEAGDGIEGLRVIDRTKPDVAILDITMKGLSGIEMIPRIKSISPRTKIVMYTMHENADFIQQAMQAGAKGFVLKLDPSTELETAIRQVYSGQNYLSSTASAKIIDCIITGKDPGSTDDSTNALTPREHEISNLIAQGFDTTKIGQVLFISPKTVRVHRANIMKKLSCETTSELIVRLRDQLNSQTGM
jgi:DNA-binding NarL/FixJ family response regulator